MDTRCLTNWLKGSLGRAGPLGRPRRVPAAESFLASLVQGCDERKDFGGFPPQPLRLFRAPGGERLMKYPG